MLQDNRLDGDMLEGVKDAQSPRCEKPMISWLSLGALALVALSAFLLALVGRRRFRAEGVEEHEAFRDRLREIEREVDSTSSSGSEIEVTLVDIKRRLLLAARSETSLFALAPRILTRSRGVYLAALVPGIALGAALALSEAGPRAPVPLPAASSGYSAVSGLESVETLVAHLAARLQAQPEDVPGWRKLGWSYVNLGRYQDAAWAYGKAAALQQDSAAFHSAYGEATVLAAEGRVTAEALRIFETALALDSAEPRARFYLGLAQHQAGNKIEALAIWSSVIDDAAPAAAWLPDLHSRRSALAKELGISGTETPPAIADAAAEPDEIPDEIPDEGLGDS